MKTSWLLSVLFLIHGLQPCLAQETQSDGDDWEAQAKKRGLSTDEIAAVSKSKVLITKQAFRQVFSAYIESPLPSFITSDSLLSAFHTLFEESIFRMESANAGRLADYLRHIWLNLEKVDTSNFGRATAAAARLRAQIVLGVALRLIDDESVKLEGDLRKTVDEEVKRVIAAEETHFLPPWLGKPDASLLGLDYTRYGPRGFYTRTEQLQRYFRAVSWLQSIPFRLNRDEEFLAILMLGDAANQTGEQAEGLRTFLTCYRHLIGAGDDWDLATLIPNPGWTYEERHTSRPLAESRERWTERSRDGGSQINDQLRFAPDDPKAAAEPNFRVLSAYRTPDGVLFQRTSNDQAVWPRMPTGLEVAAALGSKFAADSIADPKKKEVLAIINRSRKMFDGPSVYCSYLHCVAALLDDPEPDAPAFMASPAWQAKSCQTALAGWAQLRHTWVLQAKDNVIYECEVGGPAGFIEPVPEFFSRMARLADKCEEVFKSAGVLESSEQILLRLLRESSAGLRVAEKPSNAVDYFGPVSQFLRSRKKDWWDAKPAELADLCDKLAADIEKGVLKLTPEESKSVQDRGFGLRSRWRRLGELCRQVESLTHKQLRGRPMSREENWFVASYGETLAGIMFYEGNSYVQPRDNAMRIADVVSDPNSKKYLLVGVSRPRAIYVLYPWQGKEYLCRGAVTPYYEFTHSARLTDAEWLKMLDSKDRPAGPVWLKSVAPAGLGKPVMKER